MKSMIGICAPYVRQDSTFAALRVASLLREMGHGVGVAATGHREAGVHADWDPYVPRLTQAEFDNWLTHLDAVVWFDVQRTRMEMAKVMGIPNIIFPMWRNLRPEDCRTIEELGAKVVYPSPEIADRLQDFIGGVRADVVFPWDAGLPPVTKRPATLWRAIRYFVPVVGDLSPRYCELVVKTLETILTLDPIGQVTFCPTKQTFPKRCRGWLERLVEDSGERLTVNPKGTYYEYVSALSDHDWMILLSPGDNVGMAVAEAFACGVPVVAFDIPPFCEMIADGQNGRLIACDLKIDRLSVPEAVPALGAITGVLEQIVADPKQLWGYSQHIRRRRNPAVFGASLYRAITC